MPWRALPLTPALSLRERENIGATLFADTV